MSGNRILLDTNAITALLQGNTVVVEKLKLAEWVGISVINELEFLANPELDENDKILFKNFIARVEIIDLTYSEMELLEMIVEIRKNAKIKLPDAIIAGTAIYYKAKLLSSDSGFRKVGKLKLIEF
jgi:tRNA(fMet)-specific endonuclease VapC